MLDTVLLIVLFCAIFFMLQAITRHNHLQNQAEDLLRVVVRNIGYSDGMRDGLNDKVTDYTWDTVVSRFDHFYRKK